MPVVASASCQTQEAPPQQEAETPPAPPGRSMYDRVELLNESFPYNHDKPALGHWHGNVHTGFGWPAASIVISESERGEYVMTASITPGNRPHAPITSFTIDGPYVEFRFPLDPPEAGRMHFVGRISEDGQRMTGELEMPREMIDRAIEFENEARQENGEAPLSAEETAAMTEELRPGTFELARTPLVMDLPEPIAYRGHIELEEDVVFEITVAIAQTPGGNWVGHMDLPDQFFSAWPLDKVKREGDHLVINMGGGTVAVFDGTVSEDGQTYSGTYSQLELRIPFEFTRVDNYTIPVIELPEALRPEPNIIRETTIEHPDGHSLAATLTIPTEGNEPFPAVVLISGQGAQQRDYRLFGHAMFADIAGMLAKAGIASLRFDDRGVGESSGQFQSATTADFASDATAAFNWLKSLENIDPARIGFLGHDEGAVAAAIAGDGLDDCGFVIMLSGRGVPGVEYDLHQLPFEIERVGLQDPELSRRYLDTARALLEAVVAGADEETLNALALTAVQAQIDVAEALGGDASASAEQSARSKLRRLQQPWPMFHLRHDPAETLRGLDCPVLAIWGDLDRIADPDLNRAPIEEAVKSRGGSITVGIYPGLNHMLQPSTGDTPDHYRTSPVAIDEQVVNDIAAWILSPIQ